jgi:hypothetical protein
MMTLNPTVVSSTQFSNAWLTKPKNTDASSTTASPRSATVAASSPINPSGSPNYGETHNQAVALKTLAGVEQIESFKKPPFGIPTYESLTEAYNILMSMNSTANLSAEQKSVLAAATGAWLSQNPSDAISINNPARKNEIAKKVGTIFKTLILDNYQFVTAATIQDSNVLGKVALPNSQAYQLFFAQKLSLSEIDKKRKEIGTATSPITGFNLG